MKSDMENKDWLNDYMSLKQVSKANPFTVPDGYFDNLADRIASFKNLDELKDEELTGGFAVPENYFDELTANISSRINIEAAFSAETDGFAIPEGYFENLSEQIQSRIFIEEALAEPAEAFTVPQDYFNKLSASILDKTVNLESSKSKGIVKRMITSTAFKYATAACFAVAIGGGILINVLSPSGNAHQNSFLHKQLSSVPVDDIENYLQLNVDAGDIQQTVTTEGAPIDDKSLKDALQNDIDSAQ